MKERVVTFSNSSSLVKSNVSKILLWRIFSHFVYSFVYEDHNLFRLVQETISQILLYDNTLIFVDPACSERDIVVTISLSYTVDTCCHEIRTTGLVELILKSQLCPSFISYKNICLSGTLKNCHSR